MGMAATESQFHVLAVDDSIIDRKLIERLLKNSSYQVTTVDSGCKALQFLGLYQDDSNNPNQSSVSPNNHQEMEVNLVITDYCMPEMTGYDLLKKIKESSLLRDIPVVIMSSENVPSRISRCLEEGAEEFLLKPVRLSDVNKLKPHMKKKTKFKNNEAPQNEDQLEIQELTETSSDKSEISSQKSQNNNTNNNNCNINKRKAIEEGLSPERTRPRFSDITVVSNELHIHKHFFS